MKSSSVIALVLIAIFLFSFGFPLMQLYMETANAFLVVQGGGNCFYYRKYNYIISSRSSWGSWSTLPSGSTGDSPSAALIDNELHVVVRGMNYDQIWHACIDLQDNTVSEWQLLSGSTPSAPTLTANSTHLCLVVRGQDSLIYYRFYNIADSVWGDWTAVPSGATIDSPGATLQDNTLHIVVRGVKNDQIWYSNIDLVDNAFSGWTLLSGSSPSAPTLIANNTHLCLVVRGQTNAIFYRFYDTATQKLNEWTSIPTGGTCDSPAATITDDQLHIVVRGVNNDQLWHSIINLKSEEWTEWTLLDGSTPSKPVLVS